MHALISLSQSQSFNYNLINALVNIVNIKNSNHSFDIRGYIIIYFLKIFLVINRIIILNYC